jgi:hypothetical protein
MLSKRGCMSLKRCPSNLVLNCALEYHVFRHHKCTHSQGRRST